MHDGGRWEIGVCLVSVDKFLGERDTQHTGSLPLQREAISSGEVQEVQVHWVLVPDGAQTPIECNN